MKQCRDCGAVKDLEEFYINPQASKGTRGGDGRRSRCIPCYREFIGRGKDKERQRKQQREKRRAERAADPNFSWRGNLRRYGMTPEDYDSMLEEQGGVCAICGIEQCSTGTRFSVDHDHSCCPEPAHIKRTCGKCNRGLLCRTCNVGIGNLKEDVTIMKNAIAYLERTALKLGPGDCEECDPDYKIRMTEKWLEEAGAPLCPHGIEMEEA